MGADGNSEADSTVWMEEDDCFFGCVFADAEETQSKQRTDPEDFSSGFFYVPKEGDIL